MDGGERMRKLIQFIQFYSDPHPFAAPIYESFYWLLHRLQMNPKLICKTMIAMSNIKIIGEDWRDCGPL